jgi:hypothetical protein
MQRVEDPVHPSKITENIQRALLLSIAVAAIATICLSSAYLPSAAAQDAKKSKSGSDDGAGIVLSTHANAKDVGLPIYPGAKPHKDEKDDTLAANFGLWGSTFGFKLVVLKMESADSPDKIAAFYQKALAKYGPVLDCNHADANANAASDKKKDSNKLTCEDDKPEPGKMVFKSGTKEKQRTVGVQANGAGTLFQLVYVEARSKDKEPL